MGTRALGSFSAGNYRSPSAYGDIPSFSAAHESLGRARDEDDRKQACVAKVDRLDFGLSGMTVDPDSIASGSDAGSGTMADLLRTRPRLLIGGMVIDNPHYLTPDEFRLARP